MYCRNNRYYLLSTGYTISPRQFDECKLTAIILACLNPFTVLVCGSVVICTLSGMCVCVFARTRVCMCICLSVCLPAVCLSILMCTRLCVCVCVCVCVCSNGGYNVIQCSEREERESLLLVLSSVWTVQTLVSFCTRAVHVDPSCLVQ